MANVNCLDGIRCPKCGNEDRFNVVASVLVEVTDDGTGDSWDIEYASDSMPQCATCKHVGKWSDFEGEQQ